MVAGGDAAWLPFGQPVSVAGYPISGGFIYIGRQMPGETTGRPDPALIDPSLPVDRQAPDYAGANMGYWPSYSTIAPGCRAAYLHWLADGRHAPGAYIGYVFLYFYGLERRLLVDSKLSAAARAEHGALIREVRRLLGIYGMNSSFSGYAESLLSFATPVSAERRYLSPPPNPPGRVGAAVRVPAWPWPACCRRQATACGVGYCVAAPASERMAATPATRCPGEFNEIFARRYQERFGHGLLLQPGSTLLQGAYRPASGAIASRDLQAHWRLPDVADLEPPIAKLRELADDVCTELDAYSRYLGRHPDAAGTAAALALLPPGLERPADAATQALLSWAEDSLGAEEYVMVPAAELLARWSAASAGNGTGKSNASLLARVLERHGMGMEPDVRFGGPGPAGQAPVALFRRASAIIQAPSDGYAAAATLIQLGAAVVSADGRVTTAERDMLEHRVILAPGLAEDERRRLRAHFMRVLAEPPTPAALRKRMSLLPDAQRREAGDLLLALTMLDGGIDQAEIDRLTRLFDALGLDRPDLYGQLHTSGDKDLARLRTTGTPGFGYAIPRPPPRSRAAPPPLSWIRN